MQQESQRASAAWALPAGVLTVAVISAFAAWLFKAHCLFDGGWSESEQYVTGCYSDMVPFWSSRGVAEGRIPYLQARMEYPVLTGFMIWLEGAFTRLLFGSGPKELPFLTVATLANLGLLLGIAVMLARMGLSRERLRWLVAGPPVLLYLGHNWDLLAIAFLVLAILFHRNKRAFAAGMAVGLGASAKLFPILLLPLLVFDWLGRRDFRRIALTLGGAALAWLAVNLPIALAAPENWAEFYRFSRERYGTFAATWSLLEALGFSTTTEDRNNFGALTFMIGAVFITLKSWRRHAGEMWMLITPVVALFLLTNKVYSPQFDFWLVPLLLLTAPRLWPLAALFAATTLVYWMEFWLFAGLDGATPSATQGMLAAAAWLRVAVLVMISVLPLLPGSSQAGGGRLQAAWARLAGRLRGLLSHKPMPESPSPWSSDPPSLLERTSPRLGWVVLLAAAVLLLYRLGDPPESSRRPQEGPAYVHDECYQAFTAHRYVLGDPNAWSPWATRKDAASFATSDMTSWTTYEWVHPPSAKLVMAGFIRALGFTPVSYRLGSVVFGLLTLFLLWRVASRMRGPVFGLLALSLLAMDGMWFVFSRIAMNDIYVTGCVMAAMYAAYRFWTDSARRPAWLLASGALFGLGITMKWNAAPVHVGMMILTLGRIIFDRATGACRGRALTALAAAWLGGYLLAPPVLYLLSYTPYFLAGHSLADLGDLHYQIWSYHHALKAQHSQGSPWWQWPLMIRPVWLFLHHSPEGARTIHAMGNPLLWWLFLPALAYVAFRYLRRREPQDAFILCGFMGAWLPWAFVGRVAFMQYLLPGLPFGALAVAMLLRDLTGLTRRWRVPVAGVYAACCLAAFAHFYPILSARPVSPESLAGRRWFWVEQWRGY
jgi:predicted membrane-bound dolichyl-phosphate-mannose-protein mannosyltransferase